MTGDNRNGECDRDTTYQVHCSLYQVRELSNEEIIYSVVIIHM